LLVGFIIGLLIFGTPWHLTPNWGDVPTWLAVAVASVGGWIALSQLRGQQQQITDESDRNARRDELLDKQLAEAETRADEQRRQQAEGVKVRRRSSTGYVINESRRPIRDITCKIMSKVDSQSLASPTESGEVQPGPGHQGWVFLNAKQTPRLETLRPDARGGFSFPNRPVEPDHILVAWFTDDAGFRWQLDEDQHLVSARDGDQYIR
jgi:hypothetical protein